MKVWIYLPILVFVSVLYSRLAVNSGEYEPTRGPASEITSAQPSSELTQIKFHDFFKANNLLFLKSVQQNRIQDKLKTVSGYHSTIVGDVHIENFGVISDDSKKFHLLINDVDESSEGEIYIDVLRHFISSEIIEADLSWKDYLKAYTKGLKEESFNFSSKSQKVLDNAFEDSQKMLDAIVLTNNIKFLKRKGPARSLTSIESKALLSGIKNKYPQAKIFDQYVHFKVNAGSAGKKCFEILARLHEADKVQWIELKEEGESNYNIVFSPAQKMSFDSRLNHMKENLYNGNFEKNLSTLRIQNETYLMKKMENFLIGFHLKEMSREDLSDVVQDEAYSLGRMHAHSLKAAGLSATEFADHWEKISDDDFKQATDLIKTDLKNYFKETKN